MGRATRIGTTLAAAIGAALLLGTGAASAATLENGYADASNNTSVFISVVERNASNAVVRNLVINTGARALDVFAGTPWSTTSAQEAAILAFITSAAVGDTVRFNVGAALNDQTFTTDLQGFLTSGNAAGPAADAYAQLTSAIASVDTIIGSANQGAGLDSDGLRLATIPGGPGWHNNGWGNTVGGAIETSNELLFGQTSQIVGWKTAPDTFEIIRAVLGSLTSNPVTGDISFNVAQVPVPAAVWLLGSAVGLLGALRRRLAA